MRNDGLARWLTLLAAAGSCQAQECISCHSPQAAALGHTPMSQALERVENCSILRTSPKLMFRDGIYSYQIVREGPRSLYTVTDGKNTISAPIEWAFGLGAAGQTYVFRRNGVFYESRVSYFQAVNGLDLTLGAANRKPANLDEAAGRSMNDQDARQCFGCHSTGLPRQGKMNLDLMVPGIQCARCHESSAVHSRAAQSGDLRNLRMLKLSKLSAEEVSDFCGQCHRTWADIAANGPRGINNVRFQPYRLANSKCYDATDRRISCVACHDPHQNVSTQPAGYDAKCEACHSSRQNAQKACPVAKKDCVTCHMPKYELPGAHFKFTDHQIRVVPTGEVYPN
jgi:hypothetical protein